MRLRRRSCVRGVLSIRILLSRVSFCLALLLTPCHARAQDKDCELPGDTRCKDVTISGPEGNPPGLYKVMASATDGSKDPIFFLFTLIHDKETVIVGPEESGSVEVELTHEGVWLIRVSVADDPLCLPGPKSGLHRCGDAIVVGGSAPFLRGDCNQDGVLASGITDAIFYLSYLFLGRLPEPPCMAACDFDGLPLSPVTDVVYLLNYWFLGRSAPPDPFPECGKSLLTWDFGACDSIPAYCDA